MALEPVDMRMGYERLGGHVPERMQAEQGARALLVFVGKRGHTMKVVTSDGKDAIIVNKELDAGEFELPNRVLKKSGGSGAYNGGRRL